MTKNLSHNFWHPGDLPPKNWSTINLRVVDPGQCGKLHERKSRASVFDAQRKLIKNILLDAKRRKK